jgi:hypothetical protein
MRLIRGWTAEAEAGAARDENFESCDRRVEDKIAERLTSASEQI